MILLLKRIRKMEFSEKSPDQGAEKPGMPVIETETTWGDEVGSM